MIQELAARTGSQTAVIVTMLLVIALFALIIVRVLRSDPKEAERHARLPLDDEPQTRTALPCDGDARE